MTWTIDPLTATAIGTWVLVIGTLVLMYWQTQQTRRLNSATSVMALRERFDAPHLRRARRLLAGKLLNHQHEDITNIEVGAFFELVATLTHRGVLDDDLIWEAFGSWVTAYYWALRHPVDTIGRGREQFRDPLIFHEFEWLEKAVLNADRHRGGPRVVSEEDRERESRLILQREADLDLADA
ncbi:MAG: DUF4760 domain-containing protein [Thermoplasmata archaeon]